MVAALVTACRRKSAMARCPASGATSTAHQIFLDLEPQAPLQFAFEPPGCQLHLWREGAGLVSHTAMFGDWPGPYPFRAAS